MFLAAWLAAANGSSRPRPAADFTVTADEWAKEYLADGRAFRAKYAGKTVQVTGTVDIVRDDSRRPSVLFQRVTGPKGTSWTPAFSPSAAVRPRFEQLSALARGQQVTVRGVCHGPPSVDRCEYVAVGPSTAVPVTVAGLKVALATEAGHKQLARKEVVVRGRVVAVDVPAPNVVGAMTWTLIDPGAGDDAPRIRVAKPRPSYDHLLAEFRAAVTPGNVVVVIGEVYPVPVPPEDDGPHIWAARVLKNLPDGVKLPPARK